MARPTRFARLSARAWDYLMGDRPAQPPAAHARLRLEELEAREVPAIIYSGTASLSGGSGGLTVTETVTADAPGYAGLYKWDFVVQNNSYTCSNPDMYVNFGAEVCSTFDLRPGSTSTVDNSVVSDPLYDMHASVVAGTSIPVIDWTCPLGYLTDYYIPIGSSKSFSFTTTPRPLVDAPARYKDTFATYDATGTVKGPGSVRLPSPILATTCECGCGCPNQPGSSVLSPILAAIASAYASIFGPQPVRYADGVARVASTDLMSDAFGAMWGVTRSWTNDTGASDLDATFGNNQVVTQLPRLATDGSTVAVVLNGSAALTFNASGGGYTALGFSDATLTYDGVADTFTLTDGAGQVFHFHGFGSPLSVAEQGGLIDWIDPAAATTTTVSYLSNGQADYAERSGTVGGVAYAERIAFAYVADGVNDDKVAVATLRRKAGTGSWEAVRSVSYTYYGPGDGHGTFGDLRTATVIDPDDNVLETKYYRYYGADDPAGPSGALKYVVEGTSYDRLRASLGGTDAAVLAAADEDLAPYAGEYFGYDAQGRVTTEKAQGSGCSTCDGGIGTLSYTYTASGNDAGFNAWATKTVETLPDETVHTVYTNAYGQVMLSAYAQGGQTWADYYRFDDAGRVILHAAPSAVVDVSDLMYHDGDNPDLVAVVDGDATYLSDNAGRIDVYTYYSTEDSGEPAGYLASTALRHGEQPGAVDVDVPQEAWTYAGNTAGGVTVYQVATDTVYRNDDGTGAQTTSYAYTYFSGTNAVASVTTTLPVVSTAQNGSGVASTGTTVYDAQGRPVWSKDAAGVISYVQYDQGTGAVVKAIADVNTALTSSFAGLPAGWATPTGAGLHQVTAFEVDAQGRVTKATDPTGVVTYTVYNDVTHEVRVYAGWDATTHAATGPTVVTRENRAATYTYNPALPDAAGYTDTLTMTAAPDYDLVTGRPNGGEDIAGIVSLTRSWTNAAGQVVAVDEYFDLTDHDDPTPDTPLEYVIGSLEPSGPLGMKGTNFYETTYAYDKGGRLARTVSPTGTIYRTVYDGLGRAVSEWVGTDDTPASDYWSPTNAAGMVRTATYEYDGGGVGDSNLTAETYYSNVAGVPNQVTESAYDWRGRVVATKGGAETGAEDGGVNRPLTVYDYDNLSQVVRTRTYDGDGQTATVPESKVLLVIGGTGGGQIVGVATDSSGNVYVTGEFSGTVDLDPGPGTAALSDTAGHGFVAKYTAAGALVWVVQAAAAYSLTSDGADGLYAHGSFNSATSFGGTPLTPDGTYDTFVWKLNAASGATAWVAQAGGTGASIFGAQVTADGAGGVYLSGTFDGTASFGLTPLTPVGGSDTFVWKLNTTDGSTAWAVQATGAAAGGVVADGAGGVYVSGQVSGDTAFGDSGTITADAGNGFVWRLDASDGTTDWVSLAGGAVQGGKVATDGDGGVYAVGSFLYAGASFGGVTLDAAGMPDAYVWKLDAADGSTDWAVRAGSDVSTATGLAGVVTDGAGGVYTTGRFESPISLNGTALNLAGTLDSFVWKLDAVYGTTDWVVQAGGGVPSTGSTALAADGAGGVYVGGWFGGMLLVPTTTSSGYLWQTDGPLTVRPQAEMDYSYDDLGRVYKRLARNYDSETLTTTLVGLASETWYDERGLVRKQTAPNGPVTKYEYDSLGRVTAAYTTDGASDTTYSHALSVSDDTVFEQADYGYDAAGRVITTATRQRFDDATALGALGNPSSTTAAKARVYYAGNYYDAAGRLTDAVDVGTNGGSAWTRPSTVPTRSDTALVTSYSYGADGMAEDVTDPRGVVTRTTYDALGRTLSTVEDYGTGTKNKTTRYTYNAAGMTTLTAVNPGGADQTTEWVYGVSTTTGSGITSNDVVGATYHPDATTGLASSSEADTVTISALGQTLTTTDRNGTTHTYGYDAVGRLVSDAVTALGTGIDGAVRRHEFAYDTLGNGTRFTAFDAETGGDIVSQVARQYNGFGQLTREYQATAGAVDPDATPSVGYAYTEGDGGNHSRLTAMTYPDGRVVSYAYGTTGSADDRISRLTAMSDTSGTLESYTYLGLGTVVVRSHPRPGSTLTYIKQTGESDGDAGDQYAGLDRFGRVVDQRWVNGSGDDTDRFQYGYDRNSNRTFRDNLIVATFGEVYTNDALGQLTGYARGTLNGTKTGVTGTAARTQDWSLDALGNWTSLTTDGGTPETRTANAQNEYTAVGAVSPDYDAAGEMITDENGNALTYDAWGKLVRVTNSSSVVIAGYGYDALGRRVVTTHGSTTTAAYYSVGWQVLEERGTEAHEETVYDPETDAETTVVVLTPTPTDQYVWSPVYVDALINRREYWSETVSTDDGPVVVHHNEVVWVQQDANWNVTSVLDLASGPDEESYCEVAERYVYDPYGAVTVYSPDYGTVRAISDYDWQYLFQGLRRDEATGLYYARNRDLSVTLGRPIQSDPLQFGAGDTNFYRWEGNGPGNSVDPSGLRDWAWPFESDSVWSWNPNNWAVGRASTDIASQAQDEAIMIGTYVRHNPVSAAGQAAKGVAHGGNNMFVQPVYRTGQAGVDYCGLRWVDNYQVKNPHLAGYINGDRTWYGATFSLLTDGTATVPAAYVANRGLNVASRAGQSAWQQMVLKPPSGAFPAPSVPYPSAWRASLMPEAEAARDALALSPGMGKERGMYIGAIDKYGRVFAAHSQRNPAGGNMCAETAAFNQGGTWFTAPFMVRGPRGGTLQPGEVCVRCQSQYPPTAFPPGTPPVPGGSWTRPR